MRSTSRLAWGSRLDVGSSSSNTSGCSAQARAQGQTPLLPPTRRGRFAVQCDRARPAAARRQRRLSGGAPAAATQPQAQGHIVLRTGAQHVRPLKQHGLLVWQGGNAGSGTGRHQPMQHAQQGALPLPLAPTRATRSPGAMRSVMPDSACTRPKRTSTPCKSMSQREPALGGMPLMRSPPPAGLPHCRPPARASGAAAQSPHSGPAPRPAKSCPAPRPGAGHPCWSPAQSQWS